MAASTCVTKMAASMCARRVSRSLFSANFLAASDGNSSRCVSGTAVVCQQARSQTAPEKHAESEDSQATRKSSSSGSWLSNLLKVKQIEPAKDSHSRLLADKDIVFELLTHDVKPECMKDYLNSYGKFAARVQDHPELGLRLKGSWVVDVGDQDQAIHLWEYDDYKTVSNVRRLFRNDPAWQPACDERVPMLRQRRSQLCLAFSFWGAIQPREDGHIYEMRSYTLKPGTMIEWGNNWARGIRYRQKNNEAVAGFFAQIGVLYNVHHLWAYKDLYMRDRTRSAAWRVPGWDEVVAYTVPLMRSVEAKIMIPTEFSPLK